MCLFSLLAIICAVDSELFLFISVYEALCNPKFVRNLHGGIIRLASNVTRSVFQLLQLVEMQRRSQPPYKSHSYNNNNYI